MVLVARGAVIVMIIVPIALPALALPFTLSFSLPTAGVTEEAEVETVVQDGNSCRVLAAERTGLCGHPHGSHKRQRHNSDGDHDKLNEIPHPGDRTLFRLVNQWLNTTQRNGGYPSWPAAGAWILGVDDTSELPFGLL